MKEPMASHRYSWNGVISTVTKIFWPLMYNNIVRSDLDKVIEYLKQDDPKLTHGPLVMQFEKEWSKWLGVRHSVMVNSGSSANDLTLIALRQLYGQGEVIVPPLTWVSDISSVLRADLTPVFVDIDAQSLALDADLVLNAITPRTRAVFLTHVLGFNGLTDRLLDGLREKNIPLIEDVCESHGTTHHNQKVGSFGLVSNFSFYYAHHMTTIEGGMISTDDEKFYDMIRMLRSHGLVRESLNPETRNDFLVKHPDLNPDFIFAYASHNMRPTELNALIGLEQLKRLDDNNIVRSRNFRKFIDVLDPNIFQTDFMIDGNSNYAFTLILKEPNLDRRNKVEGLLREAGIEFRRGLSGGGNQLRQPYLKTQSGLPTPESMKVTDHIHHYAWYIGNYPELNPQNIQLLGEILQNV